MRDGEVGNEGGGGRGRGRGRRCCRCGGGGDGHRCGAAQVRQWAQLLGQSDCESSPEFGDGFDAKDGGGWDENFSFFGQLAEQRDSGASHVDKHEEEEVAEVVCDGVVGGHAHEGGEGHEVADHELGFVVGVLAGELRVAVQLQAAVAHALVRELRQLHELLNGKEKELDVGGVKTERFLATALQKKGVLTYDRHCRDDVVWVGPSDIEPC